MRVVDIKLENGTRGDRETSQTEHHEARIASAKKADTQISSTKTAEFEYQKAK